MVRSAAAVGGALLALLLVGCGDDGGRGDPAAVASERKVRLPQADKPFELEPSELEPEVTNPWFPLEPGTRWTYRAVDESGGLREVVVTATSQTRTVANGVEARVVRETVTLGGETVEDSFGWYAQDGLGTVWFLGEDTAAFEDGYRISHEGSFEAGVDDALAGVVLPADPMVGQSYREAYYAGVAEDSTEVVALDGTATVPAGSYDDLVRTAAIDGRDSDALAQEFYAHDVGLVLTVDTRSDAREELVSVETVSPAAARRAGTRPLGATY